MTEEDDEKVNDVHSMKIKNGIKRARALGQKWGRPSIMDLKNDPDIAIKAKKFRSQGHSYSEIASELNISRSSARRLVQKGQEVNNFSTSLEGKPTVPKTNVLKRPPNERQSIETDIDNEAYSQLPKSFQIFQNLRAKAKKAQQNEEGDLNSQ